MTQNNNNKLRILIDGSLPWDKQEGEDRRLYGIVIILLILALLMMILVESVTIEKPDPREQQEIPERLAQLVLEKQKEPPPPEPEPEPEPEEEEAEEKPEPEEPKPEPKPEPEPKPRPAEVQREEAREKAQARLEEDLGDSLAGLDDIGPLVDSGDSLRTGGDSAAKAERDLIGKRAGRGSGGVATARASSGGGGGGKVDSKIAESGQAASTTRKGSDGKSRRTQEQLRRVFDRYAGKFNSQYQRALRSNPALQGTVVLYLVIAPNGDVQDVKVKSSQLGDSQLERRITLIAKGMNFGAMNVETWKGDYKLNFFPN